LGAWGEPGVKRFVQEAIDEAMKLESALARLRTERRVAVLHYSPIRATVEGEPLEIFPYLGTSRLEEPLNRHPVNLVFHGHAHHGALEGRTSSGIAVYNVALPLLQQKFPDRPPFRVVELLLSRELLPLDVGGCPLRCEFLELNDAVHFCMQGVEYSGCTLDRDVVILVAFVAGNLRLMHAETLGKLSLGKT